MFVGKNFEITKIWDSLAIFQVLRLPGPSISVFERTYGTPGKSSAKGISLAKAFGIIHCFEQNDGSSKLFLDYGLSPLSREVKFGQHDSQGSHERHSAKSSEARNAQITERAEKDCVGSFWGTR